MKGLMYVVGLAALTVLAPSGYAKGTSTEKIKQAIIQESIDNYPGNCPCPLIIVSKYSRIALPPIVLPSMALE